MARRSPGSPSRSRTPPSSMRPGVPSSALSVCSGAASFAPRTRPPTCSPRGRRTSRSSGSDRSGSRRARRSGWVAVGHPDRGRAGLARGAGSRPTKVQMPMTPRERVLTALAHEEPDRVPIVIGVSNATGIKMAPYRDLKAAIGVEAPDAYLYDWPELGTAAAGRGDPAAPPRRRPRRPRPRTGGRPRAQPDPPPHSDYVNSWGSGAVEIAPGDWFPMVEPLADGDDHRRDRAVPVAGHGRSDPRRAHGGRGRAARLPRASSRSWSRRGSSSRSSARSRCRGWTAS